MAVERLARQRLGEDRARRDQRIEIDAGVEPHRFEQEHEVLGDDVAGRAGRIGTAADTALRGVEGGDAGVERRHHIGEALPARVVEMRAAGLVADLRADELEQPPDLRRIGVTDGVGKVDGVGAGVRHRRRHAQHVSLRHDPLDGAAEGGGERGLHLDLGEALVAQRDDRAHVSDDLGMGLADIGDRMRLAHGDGYCDHMRAGLERHGRVAQVRHQHDDTQVGNCTRLRDHLGAVGHLRQHLRRDERADLDLAQARLRQRRNPAVLGLGRQRALDALQPVARPDFADGHVHGRLRPIGQQMTRSSIVRKAAAPRLSIRNLDGRAQSIRVPLALAIPANKASSWRK